MNDLRMYSFSDWFWMGLKVIPAFLIAGFFVAFPVMVLFLAVAWLIPSLG